MPPGFREDRDTDRDKGREREGDEGGKVEVKWKVDRRKHVEIK